MPLAFLKGCKPVLVASYRDPAMQRKLKLIWRAANAGASWAWAWSGHLGRLILFYGLLLGSGSFSAVRIGWWGPLVAVAVFSLFALSVGALNEWDRAEQQLELDERLQRAMRDWQAACHQHCTEVERLLEVWKAKAPPGPPELRSALAAIGTAEAKQRRDEAQRHERETVAAFLASNHLDRGIQLFDQLVAFERIVDTGRPHVAEPRTIAQIEDGLDCIRVAAERLPVY